MTRAVLLAAGEGKRMRPLTAHRPKPLLPVGGKPILEHLVAHLVREGVRDLTLVVGHRREAVQKHFGDGHAWGCRIAYAVQDPPRGTGDALRAAALGEGPFLLVHGDILLPQGAVRRLLDASGDAMLGARVPDASPYGALEVRSGALAGVREKAQGVGPGLVNAGAFKFTGGLGPILAGLKPSPRGEVEFTDALNALVAQGRAPAVVEAEGWRDLAHPWDLLGANEALLKGLQGEVRGTVEDGARLHGPIVVGEGSRIRSGAYLEGPIVIGRNCDVGPNCYVRPNTTLGDCCRVGNAVEVKGSILLDGVHVGHLSYVGDSVLGEGVNLGAGTTTANLRHDNATVKAKWYGQRIDTGRRKFGAVLGDGVHTGIHTTLNVGVVLEEGSSTRPGQVVG
jgi:UDP-N-acetylglucosamine diphosphorylase / glucose-1-phosphate thymidylyltransferase / UDP-N-acetylgalactosamine diphosphorylase / glucosamine-1-phosphate N-acetyltransferase / galactosamine-1-phosphate N-acetyltransferase